MEAESEEIPVDEAYEYQSSSEPDTDWDQYSSRTLASTADNYRFENGRRYHAYREGQYWAPNDDKNTAYEEVLHHLWTLTLEDRLYLAPATKFDRVMDVGTGTGLWAFDFADQHPDSEIIATDLSLGPRFVPSPNLHFEVDDCCSDWTYPPNYFDFIHVRCLYGSIKDWPKFYKDCLEHTTPGGYIEHLEISVRPQSDDIPPSVYSGSIWTRWARLFADAGLVSGQTFYASDGMRQRIEEAGYVDVVERRFKWPIGQWAQGTRQKEIGKFYKMAWHFGIDAWALRPAMVGLGWSRAQVDELLTETYAALKDRRNRVYYEVSVVHARKPGPSYT